MPSWLEQQEDKQTARVFTEWNLDRSTKETLICRSNWITFKRLNQHIECLLSCTHCVKVNTGECCVLKELLNQLSLAQGEVSGDSRTLEVEEEVVGR